MFDSIVKLPVVTQNDLNFLQSWLKMSAIVTYTYFLRILQWFHKWCLLLSYKMTCSTTWILNLKHHRSRIIRWERIKCSMNLLFSENNSKSRNIGPTCWLVKWVLCLLVLTFKEGEESSSSLTSSFASTQNKTLFYLLVFIGSRTIKIKKLQCLRSW